MRHILTAMSVGVLALAGQTEPQAGAWKTWVLLSGSDLRVSPPPGRADSAVEIEWLKNFMAQRGAGALRQVTYWDAGPPAYRWQEIALARAVQTGLAGERSMALLNVAIYDATIAAWDSKYSYNRPRPSEFDPSVTPLLVNPRSPSYPSEYAVTAGAAAAVLSYLFPAETQTFDALATECANSRLLAGVEYPSDVLTGLELGRAAAARVIEYAKSDGSDRPWTGSVPNEPGKWTGVNPYMPQMANWRTWVLSSPSQFRPAPPPAFGSAALAAELAEVKNFPRTVATNVAAFFWNSVPVYKLWSDITQQKVLEYRLDDNPPRAARVYALASVASYDGIVACWDAKYTYWSMRPFQLDPTLTTLFPTPNFPGYVSAHAAVAGATSAMLAYLFPDDADRFTAQAEEGAASRLWGGIHLRSDDDVGLSLGRRVAQEVIDRAHKDGAQ